MEFHEQQSFRQWWLWLLMLGLATLAVVALVQQLGFGTPFGDNSMSDGGLVLFSLLIFGLLGLLAVASLSTDIDEQQIKVRYFPFLREEIPWSQVQTAQLVDYGFVGGWGIRYSTQHGRVYNIKGRMGLKLTLQNGRTLTIGTQKPEQLRQQLAARLDA
jgi:hypothetical protein